MEDVQDVAFCPHCGNDAPQLLEGHMASLHRTDGSHGYFLVRCLTCYGALLYRVINEDGFMPSFSHGKFKLKEFSLLWPHPAALHPSVPERIRRRYEEAAAIKNRAPNGFANQIRRALEALCKDRGATKPVLAQNLKELADKGEIPTTLSEMTDVLRKLGNIGSHDSDEDIDPSYVDAIDEFFRAVVEYVYIAPHKVEQFKAKLQSAGEARPSQAPKERIVPGVEPLLEVPLQDPLA